MNPKIEKHQYSTEQCSRQCSKTMSIRVTIFEDNNSLRNGLYQLINGSEGFACVGAFEDCLHLLKNIEDTKPDVVVMDTDARHQWHRRGKNITRKISEPEDPDANNFRGQ